MHYVELHCHSAFSFLDGASAPGELVPAALGLGHGALALTDHNSVSGSMEFAQAAHALGLRAIHGAEVDLDDGRHLTLLVEAAPGWSNLCRMLSRAHAHTREGRPGAPASAPHLSLEAVLEHHEGLVCLTGCARHGVRDEPTVRRLREAFGRDRLRVELQRPFLPGDRALNRGLAALARRLEIACVATGNVHAHAPRRACLQDALVAIRLHATLDACEPDRRGNHSHVLTTPAAMAARFADHPDAIAESARLADRLRFDLCADLGYRYPGAEDPATDRTLAELCHARLAERYEGLATESEAGARLEEELRVIRTLGLSGFFLLHRDMLELAREVAVEVRGPDTARALLPPGRGRGSSRLLDRLLSHRALARRPDRQQAPARALPQRGAHLAARHRPRLPARHPRAAAAPHPRALRARALGAGGGLPDLPRARRHPRPRQGAGPAARGDRAGGARVGGLVGPGGRARRGRRAGRGARALRRAGAGWCAWRRRSTACPATSPSTRAGW